MIRRRSLITTVCLACLCTQAGAAPYAFQKTVSAVSKAPTLYQDDRDITSFMNYTPRPNPVEEDTQDIYFSSDQVENNQELETIVASGNVNIVRDNLTLKADKVIYNQKDDIITATGNVVMLEDTGNVVFSDYVVLTDKMSQGEMRNIKIILRDKSRLAARKVQRLANDDKIMRNVVYTACDVCSTEDPLWQLKSRKVTHDAAEKNVNYRDAFLEIKGVPVFYTPFLSHPDPTVKRRSGFLAPTIRSNSYLGAALQPRYFWNISDHEDLTLSPIISTDKGAVLNGMYRKYFYQGDLNFSGSILHDDDQDKERGHIFLKGRYEVNDYWVASVDYNYASDGLYLKDLSLPHRDDAWLFSNAKLEGFDNRNYASIEARYYELISENITRYDKPYVVPTFSYENISDPQKYGAYFKTNFDFANIYREEETNSQRATMVNSWVLPYTSPYGEKYKLQASNKTDLYYVDNYRLSQNDTYDGTAFRMFPQLGMEWKLPLAKSTTNTSQILEPTVVAVAAPNGGNKPDKIPNDDSLYQEFDDTNVLSLDRMSGYDRNDTGSRVSYGLNWSMYGTKTGNTSAFIAQSYYFKKDDPNSFGNEFNNDSHFSDYVGRIYAMPNEYLDLNYRYKIDNSNFELKYSELSSRIGPKILTAYVSYIYLQEDKNSIIQGYKERKELFTRLKSQVTRDWSVSVYNRQDLAPKGGSLSYGGDLTYEDECLKIITDVRRDNAKYYNYYRNSDHDNGLEFSVTFLLKTLGGFGSK